MSFEVGSEKPFGSFAPRGMVARLLACTRAQDESWLGRRIAFLLRRMAIRRLHGAPLDVESLGARMRLYPYNNVCEKRILFTPQYFDAQELALIASRITDDFVFLDIGANIGGYSLFVAAHAGPRATILAIEPQPPVFEKLVANIRLNDFATVKAIACAVADKDGELTMFMDAKNQGESSVKIVSGDGAAASLRVPARNLYGLLREEGVKRVDAAKLDVEGAEDLILEPFLTEAPRSLWPRLLVLERGGTRWHIDLYAMLSSKGYKALAETRTNTVFELLD